MLPAENMAAVARDAVARGLFRATVIKAGDLATYVIDVQAFRDTYDA